ncbi:hypothetical protein JCM15765_21630 [Paradesulfitobacterium aromaticivorans]
MDLLSSGNRGDINNCDYEILGVYLMAHKTFISYKYSEAQKLRDDIITALGDDATYYNSHSAS